MDAVQLSTLRDELFSDCEVAENAAMVAQRRLAEETESGLEGCGHHLTRLYNVIEQMALRVARLFENEVSDESRWHAGLIHRLSIDIRGVRPAFFPRDLQQPLRELRGFRHVYTHAYDRVLDRDKLELLIKYSNQVVPRLRELCRAFIAKIAQQEGISELQE